MCTRCVMVATVCLVGINVFFLAGHWSLRLFIKTTVRWLLTSHRHYIIIPSRL